MQEQQPASNNLLVVFFTVMPLSRTSISFTFLGVTDPPYARLYKNMDEIVKNGTACTPKMTKSPAPLMGEGRPRTATTVGRVRLLSYNPE